MNNDIVCSVQKKRDLSLESYVAAEPEYETAEQQNRKATATTLSSRSLQVVGQVGEQTTATAAVKSEQFHSKLW